MTASTRTTQTGGPRRTARTDITPLIPPQRREQRGVYPILLWDTSSAALGPAAPGVEIITEPGVTAQPGSLRQVMTDTAQLLVSYLETAHGERSLLTYFFGGTSAPGTDLTTASFERKVGQVTWGGPRRIMGAWNDADKEFEGRFGQMGENERPVQLAILMLAGAPDDMTKFTDVLGTASPRRMFEVAVLGHGGDHVRALDAFGAVATEVGTPYLSVHSFESVTDPQEIAADLQVAMS